MCAVKAKQPWHPEIRVRSGEKEVWKGKHQHQPEAQTNWDRSPPWQQELGTGK